MNMGQNSNDRRPFVGGGAAAAYEAARADHFNNNNANNNIAGGMGGGSGMDNSGNNKNMGNFGLSVNVSECCCSHSCKQNTLNLH